MDVADDEAVRPRVHVGQGRAVLLDDAGCGGVLEDRERPVLPPLAPVAADHDADRRPQGGGAAGEALPDEELPEHAVDGLRPHLVPGGAVVAAHGDGGERLAGHVAGVVVRPRLVGVVSTLGVILHPVRQAHAGLREQRAVHPGRVVEPVVGERDERGEPAHRVAGVVRDRDDDRRGGRAAVPALPGRADALDAPQAVAHVLVVVEGRPPVRDGLGQVGGVPGRLVGEGAGDGGVGPGVGVGPSPGGVVLGRVDGLLAAGDHGGRGGAARLGVRRRRGEVRAAEVQAWVRSGRRGRRGGGAPDPGQAGDRERPDDPISRHYPHSTLLVRRPRQGLLQLPIQQGPGSQGRGTRKRMKAVLAHAPKRCQRAIRVHPTTFRHVSVRRRVATD